MDNSTDFTVSLADLMTADELAEFRGEETTEEMLARFDRQDQDDFAEHLGL